MSIEATFITVSCLAITLIFCVGGFFYNLGRAIGREEGYLHGRQDGRKS